MSDSGSGSESGSESGADEGIVAALRAEIAALRQAHAQEVDALKAGHRTELAAERPATRSMGRGGVGCVPPFNCFKTARPQRCKT